MTKSWKRWGALLLIAAMTLSLLPVAAFADEARDFTAQDESVLAASDEAPVAAIPAENGSEELPAEPYEVSDQKATLSAGDLTVTVPEDDITLISAMANWEAVDGVSSYTVTIHGEGHTGATDNVWYQDNANRTVKLANLDPGRTYTVTVTGGGKTGSATFTTKSATNSKAEAAKLDSEAPRPYGALPDDLQLYYHENDMAAFIHFGPNTYTGRSWGTGNESPSDFNLQVGELTDDPAYGDRQIPVFVDQWVKELQDAGFKRLIMVAKHHDGFCLWDSQYTTHNVMASPYARDLLWDVSEACTKYNMDMGFYFSPWDMHDESYGQGAAYDRYYMNQLREVLGNPKYGNHGVFVETWMDGAKGSGQKAQDYDFDAYFKLIRELQPQCLIYTDRADGGVRWSGNEVGSTGSNPEGTGAGDMCWQTMNVWTRNYEGTDTPGMLNPAKNPNKWVRQRGAENGVIWSVCECDVSIESEWFWHASNSTRALDTLIDMYLTSVGYGSPFLLNVPPSQDGSFRTASSVRLAELGKAIRDTFRTDMLRETGYTVTATASATRTSATMGKFGATNVIDGNPDTYWTMNDGQTTGSVTISLGGTRTFDVVTLKEYIPLGQRIKAGKVEYHDDAGWHDFGTFTTIGAKRIIRTAPVKGDQIRVSITGSNAVPLLSAVEVYKARSGMELGSGIPDGLVHVDDQEQNAIQYSSGWKTRTGSDYLNNTNTYAQSAASFTYTFTGAKIYVMGIKDTANGKFRVKIDNGAWTEVNTAETTSRQLKTILWTSEDLTSAQHTITVEWVSGWFDFDGLFYLPAEKSMLEFAYKKYTTTPNSTVTLTVKRSGDTTSEVSFKVNDLPGTAVQGQHYEPLAEVVTMAAGETTKTVNLKVKSGTSGNEAAGKDFSVGISEPTGNAIIGFIDEAAIDILDPEDTNQLPKGDVYNEANRFVFPSKVGQTNKLEAEHMILDPSGRAADNAYVRIGDGGSGKIINWFNDGNKVYLDYYAARAGIYTMTVQYNSGRSGTNLNTLNWRGDKVVDRAESVSGTSGFTSTSFQFEITKAGAGRIEFYANRQDSPQIDWFTFRLDTPANMVESITLNKTEDTLYLNGAAGENTVQLVATVLPADADVTPVWSSSNPDVAYVEQGGTVIARANGETIITVTAEEAGYEVEASATITVKTRVTGEVAISGTPKFDQVVEASINQISHQGAQSTLTYQWNRDGHPIPGETANTYTIVEADIDHDITVTVTVTGYYVGGENGTTSAAVHVTKADGPAVVATLDSADCTTEENNDGKITGLNPARVYEYQTLDAGDVWKESPTDGNRTEITGLTPGSYHIRVKATNTHTAGPVSRTLTILGYGTTGYAINIPDSFEGGVVRANVRKANQNDTVTLTVIPAEGYKLVEGSLMVNSEVVTVSENSGTFTMPAEEVTVSAAFELLRYHIDHLLTNVRCTLEGQDHIVQHGEKPVITLTPDEGYDLPQIIIITREDNTTFTGYTFRDGVITFTQGVTENLIVKGDGVEKNYNVYYNITPGLSDAGQPHGVDHGDGLTVTLTAIAGYGLPDKADITITINGAPYTAFGYDNGVITIPEGVIDGHVSITAKGVRLTTPLTGVTVSGKAEVGQRLETTVTPVGATATYQWFRVKDGVEVAISGATYPRYMLTDEDVGATILVKVTGTGQFSGTVTSEPTQKVEKAKDTSGNTGGGGTGGGGTGGGAGGGAAGGGGTTEPPKTDGSNTTAKKVTNPDGDVTITVTDSTGEEIAKVTLPATTPTPDDTFIDLSSTPWAEDAINHMAGLKLVNGVGGSKYDPTASMTRGSLATVLYRLSNGKNNYAVTFNDVAKGQYYTEGVAWATKAGVVTGYSTDTFAPNDTIPREQLPVMLSRYAKLIGMDTTANKAALDKFTDGSATGGWAADGMAWCVEKGILQGKGANNLDPTAKVTRAEVAVMLDRFLALIK